MCLRVLLFCWKEVYLLEIVTADEAGFCFGVQRAVNMAINAASGNKKSVYTLGSIIHNPQVVDKLKSLGITSVKSPEDISEGVLIIRSHGVAPSVLKKARKKGLDIVDATCPYVKKAQKYVQQLVNEGYHTFIFGEKNHPEVKGIYGFSQQQAKIIKDRNFIDNIKLKNKVGFVAQTTQSPEAYKSIISSVINSVNELKVFNTICNTTQKRQNTSEVLARQVDIMFVIGGFNSANTNRLAEICSKTGTPTYHIETIADIDWDWLKNKKKIGITAGASTPDWLIKEVIQAMKEEKSEDQEITMESAEEEQEKELEGIDNENMETNEKNNEEEIIEDEISETQEESNENNEEIDETTAEEENDEITAVEEEPVTEPEEQETNEDVEMEEQTIEYSDIANLKKGQKVSGKVVEIQDDGVYVDVNYKSDGFIPHHELSTSSFEDPSEIVEMDEEIEVVILTLEDEEGNMILSKKQADYEKAWEEIIEVYEDNEIIEAEVTKEVKGGLVVDLGIRGFIPASHVAIGYIEDLSDYIGKELELKIIEVERENKNVVLSHKEVLEKERAQEKEETLSSLEEDQTLTGTITKLVDFGAFVDIGGVEGLLHISEMSWGRIGHPSEIFSEGDEIEVKVLSVNKDEERISLGYKQLQPDPWEEFAEKHYEGEVVEGEITKTVDFGAFMKIENGIEGLIHISQLSQKHVKTPDEVVSVGETCEAKILNIDPEQKRVGLSIKEIEEQVVDNKNEKQSSKNKSKQNDNEEDKSSGATIGELVGDIFDE